MQMADGKESPFEVGKILVRDLARNTTEDDLKRHFMRFGGITEVIIPFDGVTGKPHSFGFVTFSDPAVITVVLYEPHPINGIWAEVSRAMKGEDLQTLESQRIMPRPVSSRRKLEGSGDIDNKSIFVLGSQSSRLTRPEVMGYFLGYGNVWSCSFTCDQSCGPVVFDNERTVDRVLHKSIHNLDGRLIVVIPQRESKNESIRYLRNSNMQPPYQNHDHGSGAGTYGGVDRAIIAPPNNHVTCGYPANAAVVGDQWLKGKEVEVRERYIPAPNVTIPQTRPFIMFGSLPFEADFGNQNLSSKEVEVKQTHGLGPELHVQMTIPNRNHGINLGYLQNEETFRNYRAMGPHELAPRTTPYANHHAILGYSSKEGVLGNHEVIRPYESAANTMTSNKNRGIDLGYQSNDGGFGSHMVTGPYESAPSMMAPRINRGINLGYQSNHEVLGDHRVTRPYEPATNTRISQSNSGINLGYSSRESAFGNNKPEGMEFEVEQRYGLVPILPRDAAGGSSYSNYDQTSQEEIELEMVLRQFTV